MTAATALTQPGQNTLSTEDIDALQEICHSRLGRGIAGHLTRQFTESGESYAVILNEPEGETVFKLSRLEGTYSLAYCSPLYGQHIIAESRQFPEILAALPEWPPSPGLTTS